MILFYDIFIYPLELFMDFVLGLMLKFTDAPLFSLSILSLVVTVISLPIYHIAETWQDNERTIQKKLKPKILEFKNVFKGSSLNTYINTLYRQNNYHPIQAVRTSFGLLIQIPFFFAAYHLLSNYGAFDGLKTIISDDLGKPDGMLSLGSITINVLPFVMTAVNIASSFIYSKKMVGKEKVQLYAIAALFLVVLYNSPAALLFYWTFNNIFSLIKNIIYTKLYKDGVITTSEQKAGKPVRPWILKLYNARPHLWGIFSLSGISATAFFIGFFNAPEKNNTEFPALIISLVPLFTISFFLLISNIVKRFGKIRVFLSSIYIISLITSLTLFFIRVTLISDSNSLIEKAVYISLVPIVFELGFLFLRGMDLVLIRYLPEETISTRSLFNKAALVAITATFISAPLTILSSGSASDFEDSIFYYSSYLIIFSAISFILIKLFYAALSPKWKTLVTILMLFLSILFLVNIFIFTGSYGDMSHFLFKDEIVNSALSITLNAVTAFTVLIVSFFLIIKNKIRYVTPVLVIAFISLLSLSVVDAYSFSKKRDVPGKKSSETEKLFNFSKTGKNVVVLMLDRFIGGYVPQALEFLPELKKDLDGFIWYPNTLSPASYTIGGVPAVMGGWDYYVKTVNSTRTDIPLMDKLDESARILPYNFDKAGFNVDIYADVQRWFKDKDKKFLGKAKFHDLDLKEIRNTWLEKSKIQSMQEDNTLRKQLLVFGLFRSAPVFLRKWIYDEGTWHIETEDDNENDYKKNSRKYVSFHEKSQWRKHTCLKYYAVLDFLPEFSKVLKSNKSRFIYLSNNLPHEPHSINANFEFEPAGKISYPKKIQQKFGNSTNSLKHLYADTASLRMVNEWIKWMKKNDVYDNTRIILVSDHGRDVFNPFFDRQKIPNTRKKAHPAYFNNLLMVKDFNSRGELKTSQDFMTSLDVPYLAMQNIIEGKNPFTETEITIPEKKLPFIVYDTQWRNEKQGKYEFKYHEKYEVSGDISKMKNWKILKEK